MRKQATVIGFALFAMFFGAGNLIFPPYLGMESGTLWPLGVLFFILIDVVIACLGIYALNAAGGGEVSFERAIGKIPAILLNSAAILCTGVFIAMPRTAATTYEMSVVPTLGSDVSAFWFSLVYFALVLVLVIRESRVVDIIGKILTPLLVIGVGILIIAGLVNPFGVIGPPLTEHVVQKGINAGYQAMDVICVIGYSIILKDTLLSHKITDRKKGLSILLFASILSGVMLTLIYGGLAYLGAMTGMSFGPELNQAELIVQITYTLMGDVGVGILGVVVFLACLSTAIGLISAAAAYFEHITNGKLSYRTCVIICVIAGIGICNIGLDAIIALASPILSLICPPFMITIILLLFRNRIASKRTYQYAALGAFAASIFITLQSTFGILPVVELLPLYDYGFAWLPFAVLGMVIAYVVNATRGPQKRFVYTGKETPSKKDR